MSQGQAGGDVGGHIGGPIGVQRTLGGQDLVERSPVDVLHDDVVGAVLFTPVEHRHDVRVVQVGGGLCLTTEALDERRVAGEVGVEHLDRDRPVEQLVLGQVHDGHAAPPELAVELVAPVVDGQPAGI